MVDITKKEDMLYDNAYEIEIEVMNKLMTVINAKWDCPTLQVEIETLMKQYNQVYEEIEKIRPQENKN